MHEIFQGDVYVHYMQYLNEVKNGIVHVHVQYGMVHIMVYYNMQCSTL